MTNYNSYRESKGIQNTDMVRAIRSAYPRYSKVQQSMVNNPEKNGVCLLPEAEAILVKEFGNGPGLTISVKPKRSHSNKDKPNRLYVRLNDDLCNRVEALMKVLSLSTKQDLIEAAIVQMCNRYGV